MKNIFLTLGFMLCLISSIFSQPDTPKDYYNKVVKKGQLCTTQKVLRLLESEKVDSVLLLIDSNYLNKQSNLKSKLENASKQIQKVKSFTEVSEGLIVYSENHNIYRCVYSDKETDYQLIDLHYLEGDSNSKIVKIEFKDKTLLMKEKQERNNNNEIPLPPF